MKNIFKHLIIILFLLFVYIIPFSIIGISTDSQRCSVENFWCIGDILWSYSIFIAFIYKVYPMWVVTVLYIAYYQYIKKNVDNKNRIVSSILYIFIILLLGLYILPDESSNTYLILVLLDIIISIIFGYLLYKLMIYSFKEKLIYK
jgi:hypothetical protein